MLDTNTSITRSFTMQRPRIVFLNRSESDGDRRITDKCLTGGSRIHHAFYIILLDNFMGPILGEEKKGGGAQLKALRSRSALPPTPPSPFLPTLWSATVRAILCWFTGWEDGNCCWTVLQDGGGKKGTEVREHRRGGGPGVCSFWQCFLINGPGVRRYENKCTLMVDMYGLEYFQFCIEFHWETEVGCKKKP